MTYKIQTMADLKAKDEGFGSFSGYASTWDNWDSVNERPARGAFKASLQDFIGDGFIALHHAWETLPIATVKEAFEDDHGLFLTADFHSTDEAQRARTVLNERLARGKSAKLSIGYEVLRDSYVNDPPGGRVLEEIKLYEVSLVTVPANDRAAVLSAKGQRMTLEDHANEVLVLSGAFRDRMKDIRELLAKEGRPMSAARRARLQSQREALAAILEDIDALLAETEPKPKADPNAGKADPAVVRALLLENLHMHACLNGVFQP